MTDLPGLLGVRGRRKQADGYCVVGVAAVCIGACLLESACCVHVISKNECGIAGANLPVFLCVLGRREETDGYGVGGVAAVCIGADLLESTCIGHIISKNECGITVTHLAVFLGVMGRWKKADGSGVGGVGAA